MKSQHELGQRAQETLLRTGTLQAGKTAGKAQTVSLELTVSKQRKPGPPATVFWNPSPEAQP